MKKLLAFFVLISITLGGCAALDTAAQHARQAGETIDTVVTQTPLGLALPPDWRAGILLGTSVLGAAAAAYEAKRANAAKKTLTGVVRAVEDREKVDPDAIKALKADIGVKQAAAGNYDTAERVVNTIKTG